MRNGRPESVAESQEMGDGEKGDRSLESGDGSWEMGDERWETVDRSQETGDMSRETEGRSRETGDWVWGLVCMSPHAPMSGIPDTINLIRNCNNRWHTVIQYLQVLGLNLHE